MQNVVLIGLLIDVLDRHLRVEVFKKLCIALLIVIDRSLPQIPLPTVFEILIAALFKCEHYTSCHFDIFHLEIPPYSSF